MPKQQERCHLVQGDPLIANTLFLRRIIGFGGSRSEPWLTTKMSKNCRKRAGLSPIQRPALTRDIGASRVESLSSDGHVQPTTNDPKRSQESGVVVSAGYLITLSAWISKCCGMTIPSSCAVLRLTNISNFCGSFTGKSPGLAPFKISTVYSAARR